MCTCVERPPCAPTCAGEQRGRSRETRRSGPTTVAARRKAVNRCCPRQKNEVTADLHVLGTGLIGTSIGLALAGEWDVVLSDRSPVTAAAAVDRGAGRLWDGQETARLLVVAVPPSAIASVLVGAQQLSLAQTYSHVGSVQSRVQAEVQSAGMDLRQLCASHPVSGRERSGPAAASADLFAGRPWVLCPSAETSDQTRQQVDRLVRACGAQPLLATASQHDAALALVSHLPQVAASALAALLVDTGYSTGLAPSDLAGPGLQDTTRIAASDPDLWLDVLSQNATQVAPLVDALAGELTEVARALAELGRSAEPQCAQVVLDLLRRGNAGRRTLPVKPGSADRDLVAISVSIPDRPGQLAAVLLSASSASVNVEDVRVEHLAGRPRGVVALLVRREDVPAAEAGLRADGWDVQP